MQDFQTKQSALFACLDDASKEIKGTILDQGDRPLSALMRNNNKGNNNNRSGHLRDRERNLSFLRGKESIFKKPERPLTRCLKARQTPDYQMNPHKWKKYSLSDVDISDHTNTTAAFAFLREMDEQRDAGYESQSLEAADLTPNGERKIEFKRSSKISRNLREIEMSEVVDVEVDMPKLKGSKLIMPEYVVGQRKPKNKKTKKTGNRSIGETARAAGTLRLSHLSEVDNDDVANEDDDDIVGER